MKYAILTIMFLGACSAQAVIDSAFPDREKFAFRSSNGETILTYVCEPSADDAATKTRARQAHKYLDARFTKAVDGFVDVITQSERKVSPLGLNKALDKEMGDIVEKTEEQFQCLFFDYREA